MAIDTRDKRASVLGLGLASLLVLPAPAALDQPDRQQLAYCYRGLSASAPVVVTPIDLGTLEATCQVTGTIEAWHGRAGVDATHQTTGTIDAEWG